MIQKILLSFALCGIAVTSTFAQGFAVPSIQNDAPIWLEVTVENVDKTSAEGDFSEITATAKVLKSFKGADDLKEGDTIAIVYKYSPKPIYSEDGKRPIAPSSPPLLKAGRTTYAFLEKTEDGNYAPGAEAWSFAPPFGIPEKVRAELGMKAPMPPKTPPPPPPNFSVPMKAPAPPTLAPPTSKPPVAPPSAKPTEQETEEGTAEAAE